jgi:hypothetical protein
VDRKSCPLEIRQIDCMLQESMRPCVMAQAVSRWPSPQKSMFTPGSVHVGFAVDNVAFGQCLSKFFGFPLALSLHRVSPYSYY